VSWNQGSSVEPLHPFPGTPWQPWPRSQQQAPPSSSPWHQHWQAAAATASVPRPLFAPPYIRASRDALLPPSRPAAYLIRETAGAGVRGQFTPVCVSAGLVSTICMASASAPASVPAGTRLALLPLLLLLLLWLPAAATTCFLLRAPACFPLLLLLLCDLCLPLLLLLLPLLLLLLLLLVAAGLSFLLLCGCLLLALSAAAVAVGHKMGSCDTSCGSYVGDPRGWKD